MKELLIQLTVRAFRERLSVCECASFHFCFKGGMWDSILLVPDHSLSFHSVRFEIKANYKAKASHNNTVCNEYALLGDKALTHQTIS